MLNGKTAMHIYKNNMINIVENYFLNLKTFRQFYKNKLFNIISNLCKFTPSKIIMD